MNGLAFAEAARPAESPRREITLADLTARWGCRRDDVPPWCADAVATMAAGYRVLSRAEHRAAVAAALARLDDPTLHRDADANQAAFERGWSENLERCRREGPTDAALRPGYVKPLAVTRFGGRLVVPEDPYLVHTLTAITLDYVFARYLATEAAVVELGCGTGRHLRTLATRRPGTPLLGLDWTAASAEILNLLAAREGHAVRGARFDMLAPAPGAALPARSAVYTVHALEQLGEGWAPLLTWLLAQRPAIVVHHEPIVELYDPDLELDQLAIAYHHRRGWLRGYWPALQRLADAGSIEILTARRLCYGDAYTEGSLVVWRPRTEDTTHP